MKVYVVGKQNIKSSNGIMEDDKSLEALNGIRKGRIHEVNSKEEIDYNKLIEEFENENSDFRYDSCEIISE